MPTCMCGLQRVATQHNCKPVSGVNKRQRVFIWSNRGKAYWVSKARIPVDTSPRSISQSSAILLTRKHASRQQSISSQQSKHCVCKTYEPSSSAQPCAVDGSCLFHQRAEDGRCVFDGTVMHGAQVLKRILIGVEHCRLIYDGRQSRHLRKWLLGPPSESLVARALAALQSESMCTLQCKVREPKLSGSAAGTSSSTSQIDDCRT